MKILGIFIWRLLPDIGKVGNPDEVLFKPGTLNDEARQQIMVHPRIARHIVALVGFSKVVDSIATHHENIAGSGDPDGFVGEDITHGGRVLAINDINDALRAKRPYYQPVDNVAEIRKLMDSIAGEKLDKSLLEQFSR